MEDEVDIGVSVDDAGTRVRHLHSSSTNTQVEVLRSVLSQLDNEGESLDIHGGNADQEQPKKTELPLRYRLCFQPSLEPTHAS